MRVLIAALLLSISAPAFADNIAGCEVVLMEKIDQEDNEGVTEIASFRPAADFIASAYDEETEVLREIDGLPIRAIMCKRQSVVPSEADFPILATGTPFMISQNFDSTKTGLTTVFFKDGEFRTKYNGPELSPNRTVLLKKKKPCRKSPQMRARTKMTRRPNLLTKTTLQRKRVWTLFRPRSLKT